MNKIFFIAMNKVILVTTVFLFPGISVCAGQLDEGGGKHFAPPGSVVDMGEEWLRKKIHYDISWAKDADLALTLDQHLYPALSPMIEQFAKEKGLKIAVQEGTCGISLGLLSHKHVDIGGFCCPPGNMDRLPGLRHHTLGIAALGILVNAQNPQNDLETATIQNLFRGEIKNWSELPPADKATAFQQPVRVLARFHCKHRPGHWRLILDNEDLFSLRTDEVASIEDMITKISRTRGAIGYEVLWNIKHHQAEEKVKFLRVGGADPTRADDVASARYPFYRVYNITTWRPGSGLENKNASALVRYILARLNEVKSDFELIPADQLRRSGWIFDGDELVGEPLTDRDAVKNDREP
jgi:ABC-type phosphate transport system substrate-binding protein